MVVVAVVAVTGEEVEKVGNADDAILSYSYWRAVLAHTSNLACLF